MGCQILVVDDEPIVGYSIKVTLQSEGYAIEVVSSAAEALTKFEPGRYGVIITDNIMPGMSGRAFAALVKRVDPKQPVIMVTGSPFFEADPAFDLLVSKPFSAVELRRSVAGLIQKGPKEGGKSLGQKEVP